MLVFATLGPTGSNHQYVTQKYIEFHALPARIELVLDFDDALDMILSGEVDHIVQVAVHPATAATAAKQYRRVFVVDTFISASHPLGVLTRAGVKTPSSLGLQPATAEYVDTSRWTQLVPEISIASVAQGLLEGRFDSGIAALDLATANPGRFRVDEAIGVIDDAWLVYGRERVATEGIIAWRDSPAAALYQRELKTHR